MIVRDSYLPGVPILVRVALAGPNDVVNRDVWDANAVLSVSGNSAVKLSPDVLSLYNGLGSALVTFTGKGDFALTARVNGLEKTVTLVDWTNQPVHAASGTLKQAQTWSGVYHITGRSHDPRRRHADAESRHAGPARRRLFRNQRHGYRHGGRDPVAGHRRFARHVHGLRQPARTGASCTSSTPSPLSFTTRKSRGPAARRGRSHGYRAGDPCLEFRTHVRPRLARPTTPARSCSRLRDGADLHGHAVHPLVMGPEISGTSLVFENGWIIDMHNKDDADGIYIHDQGRQRACTLTGSVIAGTDDDGIDTLGSEIAVQDCIIRGCKDKGVSIYGGAGARSCTASWS